MTRVELIGPPASPCTVVMMTAGVKTCSEPITAVTVMKTMVGLSSGKVMCQKLCHRFAPSILAASCSSRGMPCKPARKITML